MTPSIRHRSARPTNAATSWSTVVVGQFGADLFERAGDRRCLARITRPQQVEIAGELGRAVEDPGDLPDHDDACATPVERRQRRQGVEPDRVVGGDGAHEVVGRLVVDAATNAARRLGPETRDRVGQSATGPVGRHRQPVDACGDTATGTPSAGAPVSLIGLKSPPFVTMMMITTTTTAAATSVIHWATGPNALRRSETSPAKSTIAS